MKNIAAGRSPRNSLFNNEKPLILLFVVSSDFESLGLLATLSGIGSCKWLSRRKLRKVFLER